MKKIFQILKFSLLIAFVTMLITSCKSENQVKNEIRFEKLNAQERAQAYEEIKLEIVKNLVCVNFGQEIYDYQADVKRKELKIYSKYFNSFETYTINNIQTHTHKLTQGTNIQQHKNKII